MSYRFKWWAGAIWAGITTVVLVWLFDQIFSIF